MSNDIWSYLRSKQACHDYGDIVLNVDNLEWALRALLIVANSVARLACRDNL